MKTECAIEYNSTLEEVYELLEAAYHGHFDNWPAFSIEADITLGLTLKGATLAFYNEMASNMDLYQNPNYILDYIQLCIKNETLKKSDTLHEFNKKIISHGTNIEEVLSLKEEYDKCINELEILIDPTSNKILTLWENGHYGNGHEYTFNDDLNKINIVDFTRFDFFIAKEEAASKQSFTDQINYWLELKYNFQQMRIHRKSNFSPNYVDYYVDFDRSCDIEIERVEKRIEMDKKYVKQNEPSEAEIISNSLSNKYQWNGSDTDLLELICSLHELNLIGRKDKKEATRKELIDCFTELFDREIKDPRSKLSKTVHRKKGEPNILERMVKAYSDYTSRKLERGRGGKR